MSAYIERRSDLVRVFASRLRSRARAEDIVQSMYEKVAAAPDEEIAEPLAYLYRMGTNLLLDEARQQKRQAARENAWADLQGAKIGGVRASDMPSPEQAAAARARLQRLLAAVETLPPQPRRAFTLHKLDGFSHAETAQTMGLSQSAVEKHVSLAIRLLVERTA